MVKYLTYLFLFASSFIWSAEFTAGINRHQVNLGENFHLTLTVKDASPLETPSLEALNENFIVKSQYQSSTMLIKNGQLTATQTWKISLVARQEGTLAIPLLTIKTTTGILTSNPLEIQVINKSEEPHADIGVHGTSLSVELKNDKPYKNEPVFFTVRLTSKVGMTNVRMPKFVIEDVIVEQNGEPKVSHSLVNGEHVGLIEFQFILTPLKTGNLKIPSLVVLGDVQGMDGRHGKSFLDNDFDSFFSFPTFNSFQPFQLTTNEITWDVQPPDLTMNPWIAAKTIKIEEIWDDNQTFQVGEPLSRGFKISAEGILANQLPSLSDLQVENNAFKIYADKPEVSNEVSQHGIRSTRKELYTFIPKKEGVITLPAINLEWWNVTAKEKMTAHVPARTLQIQAANVIEKQNTPTAISQIEKLIEIGQAPAQNNLALYIVIAILTVLLVVIFCWILILQKKLGGLSAKPLKPNKLEKKAVIKPKQEKNNKLPNLNPT